MACVTLKRPLEWIDPSMSAERESHGGHGSGSSSPTSMIISNSPPHTGSARSPKRLCLGAGSFSPSYHSNNHHSAYHSSPHSTSSSTSTSNQQHNTPIRSTEVADQIRNEMLRLKLIRHRTSSSSSVATNGGKPHPTTTTSSTSSTTTTSNASSTSHTKPLFSFEQIVLIVERLFKEKEDNIRREYEQALTTRLAEQYDQFVKFSNDQVQRRFDSQALPSYLS